MTERAAFTPSPYQTALANQLYRRAVAGGRITLPAVPSMIDDYVKICDDVFKAIGVVFDMTELAQLRAALNTELNNAFKASHRSEIVIGYECPQGLVLNYHVKAQWYSIEAEYEKWLATRKPPLFGVEPDARVWALAMEAENPSACSILDIGAGTGRNALPLARSGFAVDVIEVTAKFAQMIQKEVQNDQLNMRIFRNDIFDNIQGCAKIINLLFCRKLPRTFAHPINCARFLNWPRNHLRQRVVLF
jgi:SAM-dependent methyltransferase